MHRGGAEAGWRGGGSSTRVHASCRARRLVRLVYFGSDPEYLRTPLYRNARPNAHSYFANISPK